MGWSFVDKLGILEDRVDDRPDSGAVHGIEPAVKTAGPASMACDAADLFETANSYFGLLGQASHSHQDRARFANAVRYRGHAITGALTKAFP